MHHNLNTAFARIASFSLYQALHIGPVRARFAAVHASHRASFHPFFPQIFCSCTSALTSGLMLIRWRRLRVDAKDGLWSLYGAFTACMSFSSCMNAASWATYIGAFTGNYVLVSYLPDAVQQVVIPSHTAIYRFDHVMSNMASSRSYWAAWQVLHSISLTFFSATNMMVLDRMRAFSLPHKKFVIPARAGMAIVIAICLVGVAGSITSAALKTKVSALSSQTAAAYLNLTAWRNAGRRPLPSARLTLALWDSTRSADQDAIKLDSIQEFSEMSVLLIHVLAFLVVGILCARRVSSSLLALNAHADADASASFTRLHRQIVFTAAVIFITFLPRATFASMKAASNALQDLGSCTCLPLCSDVVVPHSGPKSNCPRPCNMWFHLGLYLQFSPEFNLLVVLISTSLVQLVVLWGMTSERMLHAMQARDHRQVTLAVALGMAARTRQKNDR
jgi:hypothetical protein